MVACESPNNKICDLRLDLQEHGIIKAFYGPNADLYFVWPVSSDPPFEFEYDNVTGDLYFRDKFEDGTMGELRYICNIKGEDGDRGPAGKSPKIIGGYWHMWDDETEEWVDTGELASLPSPLNADQLQGNSASVFWKKTEKVDNAAYSDDAYWAPHAGDADTVDGKHFSDFHTVATSGDYDDLENRPVIPSLPSLATVATSGSYNDLLDKPVGLMQTAIIVQSYSAWASGTPNITLDILNANGGINAEGSFVIEGDQLHNSNGSTYFNFRFIFYRGSWNRAMGFKIRNGSPDISVKTQVVNGVHRLSIIGTNNNILNANVYYDPSVYQINSTPNSSTPATNEGVIKDLTNL